MTLPNLLAQGENASIEFKQSLVSAESLAKEMVAFANTQQPSVIKGSKTESVKFTYPDKVFRELVVNACAHRNYAILGSRVRVFMFTDRIEFISPGRLPNTVSIEKLVYGVSYSVNPVIVKFMENLRYIDKLGRGLPMVYQIAKAHDKQLYFEEVGEEFKVTLEL